MHEIIKREKKKDDLTKYHPVTTFILGHIIKASTCVSVITKTLQRQLFVATLCVSEKGDFIYRKRQIQIISGGESDFIFFLVFF